jgi:LacI family transcriptional regulator
MRRRNPSSADVARQAGVSPTTVSFVINGRRDILIPEETRARVLQVARELGYRPNSLARSLARGRTQTIGVLVPSLDSSFTAHVVQGIQEACFGQGYRVLLTHSQHDPAIEAKEVDLLLEHRVDGLISVASEETIGPMSRWLDGVVGEGAPCIVVDDRTYAAKVDCVVSDDEGGARRAVEHLLGLGHQRIAHLCAGTRTSTARDRHCGYCAALSSAGITVDEALVVGEAFEMRDPARALRALRELPHPPTALFAANDYMAADIIEVAREQGVRVPEDMALAGYGDTRVGRYLHLTTIRQDPQRMGHTAAGRLFARLADPKLAPQEIVLPTELVVRDSCGAHKKDS